MLKIIELELWDFRGIAHAQVSLDERLTVLVGVNGVGKTACLESIAKLLSSASAPGRKANLLGDGDISNDKEVTTVTLRAEYASKPFAVTRGRRRRIQPEDEFLTGELAPINAWIDEERQGLGPVIALYGVNRVEARGTSFSQFLNWFRVTEDLENQIRIRAKPEYREPALESVRHAMETFLEGFKNLRIERVGTSSQLLMTKGSHHLAIDQLSGGERGLFALIGDLSRRLAAVSKGKDPLQARGIVLIDEIELHLHPRWQRSILPNLLRTFVNTQFVVTTHSPQVLSEVKANRIRVLSRDEKGLSAHGASGAFGLDANRILEDVMGVPARPARIRDRLQDLFARIDEGKLDEARAIRADIEREIGPDEPEFARADALLLRKETIGR